ncbi:M4 family metallopeptidase [Aeromonas schubertii]
MKYFPCGVLLLSLPSMAADLIDIANLAITPFAAPTGKDSLAFREEQRLTIGDQTWSRQQQLYQGIPVYGHSIVQGSGKGVLLAREGKVVTAIGEDIDSTTPTLGEREAIDIAEAEQGVAGGDAANARLLITLDGEQKARLAYLVDFLYPSGDGLARPFTLIDAHSGEVLDRWEGLTRQEARGYGGNQKSGRYDFSPGSSYGPMTVSPDCRMETPQVRTIDMGHQQYGGQVHRFSCPVNSARPVNGAYSPLNDAHYFGQKVFDLYREWLGVNPLRQQLVMRVHYGYQYGNAFWDGRQMTFGDGNAYMYPLATWDVIAHEVSHGFTEQNSGLEYRGMSGGINESFSDVSAAALGQYVHGSFNWKMGEHVMKQAEAMRYFIQPSRDGASIDHASRYYPGMDVHHSSGVFNKAFYHLATTQGWDIRKAFTAYATANRLYWGPTTDFQQGADGVCKAAAKLGYPTGDVANAFAQVGVQTSQCQGGDPRPEPTPEPQPPRDLEADRPLPLSLAQGEERHFRIPVTGAGMIWLQTYGGSGEVDLYAALDQAPSTSRYDCRSANQGNDEACGFEGVEGQTLYLMVRGRANHSSTYLLATQEEAQQGCNQLPQWSPYSFYRSGSEVTYQGYRFTALADNWGADPFANPWLWYYLAPCDQAG